MPKSESERRACASLSYAHECAGMATAKKGRKKDPEGRPPGMSDIRWRIELRRRRMSGYYRMCPDCDVTDGKGSTWS